MSPLPSPTDAATHARAQMSHQLKRFLNTPLEQDPWSTIPKKSKAETKLHSQLDKFIGDFQHNTKTKAVETDGISQEQSPQLRQYINTPRSQDCYTPGEKSKNRNKALLADMNELLTQIQGGQNPRGG